MKTFSYSFFAKLIYRYGNIPVTILLLIHLVSSLLFITKMWYVIFPLLINLAIIYFLNRHYFHTYKTFPCKIEIDNEKMICSNFLIGNRILEIRLKDIDNITGGIFSGNLARPIYTVIIEQNIKIGISQHIKNYNRLLTTILSNVTQELYNDLLGRMQDAKKRGKTKEEKNSSK